MYSHSNTYSSARGHTLQRALILILLICTGLLVPLNAGASPATQYPLTIEDSLGNEITIDEAPQRVVLAGKATLITANAYYLFEEAREKVVAIGKTNQGLGNFLPYLDRDYENATKLPHQVGPEQIVAQRPDLVIIKSFMYKRLGKPLSKLGIPVVALDLENPAAFNSDIRRLGKILDEQDRAEEIVRIYQERLTAIKTKTDTLSNRDKPRVLLLYYSVRGNDTSFNIPPKGWIQTYQVEVAGGNPVWAESNIGSGWKTVNFEQIAAWDPDTIVITSYHTPTDSFFEEILKSNKWQQLRATKREQVYAFPADFYSWAQPDVRWILGAQWLAGTLHPDLFDELDMKTEVENFYRRMYGLSNSKIDSVVLPRLNDSLNDALK